MNLFLIARLLLFLRNLSFVSQAKDLRIRISVFCTPQFGSNFELVRVLLTQVCPTTYNQHKFPKRPCCCSHLSRGSRTLLLCKWQIFIFKSIFSGVSIFRAPLPFCTESYLKNSSRSSNFPGESTSFLITPLLFCRCKVIARRALYTNSIFTMFTLLHYFSLTSFENSPIDKLKARFLTQSCGQNK